MPILKTPRAIFGALALLALPCAALAADWPVTDATTFANAVATAVAGDTITIQAGDTVTLAAATALPSGVRVAMQAGSTLAGPGPLTFSGTFALSPITAVGSSSSSAPTTISGLTINDNSTSSNARSTIELGGLPGPTGYDTVTGNTLNGGGNQFGIVTSIGADVTITGNTFNAYPTPVYTNASSTATLTLTGNTFGATCGGLVLDNQFLPGNAAGNGGSTISGNKFLNPALTVTPPNPPGTDPAFTFMNSGFGSTYVPTNGNDFNTVSLNNSSKGAYPVIQDLSQTVPAGTTTCPGSTVAPIYNSCPAVVNGDPNNSSTTYYPIPSAYPPAVQAVSSVPTLGHWGLLLLGLAALGMAATFVRRPSVRR